MENLPIDIIEDILSRLPIERALGSKGVCKTWRNVIGCKIGLLFAYADLNELEKGAGAEVQLYYGDQHEVNLEKSDFSKALAKLDKGNYRMGSNLYNRDRIVGSCNGLVCLQSDWYDNRFRDWFFPGICNPVTGEFLFIPGLRRGYSGWREFGFGYIPSNNEYKLVRISGGGCSYEAQGHVEVHTLGSRIGWRTKSIIPYKFDSSGIFANGAIYWKGEAYQGVQKVYRIVAYDLADDKVKYVSFLPFDDTNIVHGDDTFKLMLLGGNLCVIHNREGRDQIQDIWVLKKSITSTSILQPEVTREEYYYDHNWSWNKEFSIGFRDQQMNDYEPFAVTHNNEVLLWHDKKKIYCYDNDASTLTKLWDGEGEGFSCLQTIPHMNTHVSLERFEDCSSHNVAADSESSKS